MGRPRNFEEVDRLQAVAFDMFSKKGLEATSYSDIAKNAYVTKSHVQHYFPKKNVLISNFVRKSLEAVLKLCWERPEFEALDPVGKLVFLDYIQFYYAVHNSRMARMSMDILMTRTITRTVIDTGVEFDLYYLLQTDDIKDLNEFEDALRFLYGGIYDRLYDCLSEGRDFEIEPFVVYGLRLLAPYIRTSVPESLAEDLKKLDPWLDEQKRKYNRMVFGV